MPNLTADTDEVSANVDSIPGRDKRADLAGRALEADIRIPRPHGAADGIDHGDAVARHAADHGEVAAGVQPARPQGQRIHRRVRVRVPVEHLAGHRVDGREVRSRRSANSCKRTTQIEPMSLQDERQHHAVQVRIPSVDAAPRKDVSQVVAALPTDAGEVAANEPAPVAVWNNRLDGSRHPRVRGGIARQAVEQDTTA